MDTTPASASASTAASPDGQTGQPTVVVCMGMAGAGKTTFMQRIASHQFGKKETPYIINLDPAVTYSPFQSNIDIRDSVNYKKVMEEYNLGPNGGIMTSLNLFATKVDQVLGLLEKRAAPDPEDPSRKPMKHVLVDTPGQIEAFVWSASGTIFLDSLASSFPTVIAYVVDTPRANSTSTFMSNMLYACSILYKTKLPMIIVFNKTDVQDPSFVKEWMTDFDAFQAALDKEQSNNAFGGQDGVGSGYMGSLINSMSLMLEEFYSHLSVVNVSALEGSGIDDFFEAVKEKADEFRRDYQPELDRRREAREADKKKQREKELDKMMSGMSMGGTASKTAVGDIDVEENDMEPLSPDEDSDDELDDEQDREGLQARYEASMLHQEDSVSADASFAKYLHTQQG
ncbi:uncharacterized protein B0H64DRAFT_400625 [Chaetomium fimeti]|uniref:GPN-loop GTPase n=1 Tax=Chaetomium fimeti TaxID=1854472 RepID=A0AAE0LQR7_9PEZI|nr:hypothetical protein B0H64DRAFT_400625 [Chaetomium fimeti]